MLCAREVRGAASKAKLVRPAADSVASVSAEYGSSIPISTAPSFIWVNSSGEGARTFNTTALPSASAWATSDAPAAW